MKRLIPMQMIIFLEVILNKFKLQRGSEWACLQFRKIEKLKIQTKTSEQRKCNGNKRRIEG